MKYKKTTVEVTTVKPYYTPEEYLELEAKADDKNEYRNGEIIPVTGGTTNHNKIAGNFYARLTLDLNEENYDVYIGDVKLWIPKYRQFTYPDVMVIQGEAAYYGNSKTTVTNPLMIAEVLSKSTRDYDQGDKFIAYRSIPEFKEYLLIDQTKPYVIQYVKNTEGQWFLTETESLNSVLTLQSLSFEIALSQLYKRVDFSDEGGE